MPSVSRTHGPIHFEDLDPKRFEDLVRQLVYDLRPWSRIEATGRSGGDAGYDIRATETVVLDEALDDEEQDAPKPEERIWLIQCKRVSRMSPAAAEAELLKIGERARSEIYGAGLVVACDLSLTARDRVRAVFRSWGVSEFFIWTKGELEDLLLQPKNDHLLFGFFGVSYQTRRRSLASVVRARLAAKKKLQKAVNQGDEFLLIDASEERYPWRDDGAYDEWQQRGRWCVRSAQDYIYDGLTVLVRDCIAMIDDDGERWDYVFTFNEAESWNDPWNEEDEQRREARERLLTYWRALPDAKKAHFKIVNVLPFDAVLAVDERGDDWFHGPIVFTAEWKPQFGPYSRSHQAYVISLDARAERLNADPDKVSPLFPKEFGSAGQGGKQVPRS